MHNIVPPASRSARIGETEFLPSYEFYEVHRSPPILAAPAEIIDAVAAYKMRDDKIADVLMTLRDLPSRLRIKLFPLAQQDAAAEFGFDTFTPLRRNNHELSMGLVGRFWKPVLDIRNIADEAGFRAYDIPTEAKLVLRFLVVESDELQAHLITETFIHCPTRRTKMLFTPYWLVIRLVSGWLRKRTLASIHRRLAAR